MIKNMLPSSGVLVAFRPHIAHADVIGTSKVAFIINFEERRPHRFRKGPTAVLVQRLWPLLEGAGSHWLPGSTGT